MRSPAHSVLASPTIRRSNRLPARPLTTSIGARQRRAALRVVSRSASAERHLGQVPERSTPVRYPAFLAAAGAKPFDCVVGCNRGRNHALAFAATTLLGAAICRGHWRARCRYDPAEKLAKATGGSGLWTDSALRIEKVRKIGDVHRGRNSTRRKSTYAVKTVSN